MRTCECKESWRIFSRDNYVFYYIYDEPIHKKGSVACSVADGNDGCDLCTGIIYG